MLIPCISCESLDGDDSENSTEVSTEGLKLKACIGGANSEVAIMLSESADFSSSSSKLEASISKIINVSGLDLPKNLESKGNSRDGDDYLVYTFYLKNLADKSVNIQSELDIEQAFRNVDDSIRIRIYRNGVDTTYAKTARNGKPEYNTTSFVNGSKVFSAVDENVRHDEIIKYTVVAWLEGDDAECVDDIKGGGLVMNFKFSLAE